jgi:hypothetical protein
MAIVKVDTVQLDTTMNRVMDDSDYFAQLKSSSIGDLADGLPGMGIEFETRVQAEDAAKELSDILKEVTPADAANIIQQIALAVLRFVRPGMLPPPSELSSRK